MIIDPKAIENNSQEILSRTIRKENKDFLI
jgi:hypothetical protein